MSVLGLPHSSIMLVCFNNLKDYSVFGSAGSLLRAGFLVFGRPCV